MRTRIPAALAASACALLLALTATACGSDDGPPQAGDQQGVADFLKDKVGCEDIDFLGADDLSEIRGEGINGLDGGGECDQESGDIDFLHVTDMKVFAQSMASQDGDGNSLLIGKDFALDVDRDQDVDKLIDAGLYILDCDPGMQTPDGYHREDVAAGCVATDYRKDAE
ncbi:hypothetical protein [Streptomyces sp. SAS_270]|uniref:hypothetical protein n=1 Tax=Streptomyces sp. SAS_270 TaxID=3412748 RepID=UPI00403C6A90